MSVATKSLKLVVFVCVLVFLWQVLQHWIANKRHVFTKEDVARLAKQYSGDGVHYLKIYNNLYYKRACF